MTNQKCVEIDHPYLLGRHDASLRKMLPDFRTNMSAASSRDYVILEDGDDTCLRNVENHLPDDVVSHPRKTKNFITPL